jgi:small-conductance mechanosensitive channel
MTPTWYHGHRAIRLAAALAVSLVIAPPVFAVQGPPAAAAGRQADPEAEAEQPAPVLVEGEPILWITAGAAGYSTQFRAERITERLEAVIRDRSLRDPTVTVVEADGSSELHAGPHLLMVITPRDAAAIGAARVSVAQQYARIFENTIRQERLRYSPGMLLRSGAVGAAATLAFLLVLWGVLRVTGALRRSLEGRLSARAEALGVIDAEGLSADNLSRAMAAVLMVVRGLLVLVMLDFYLTFVLGLFPWTRAISLKLLGYAFSPVRAVVISIVSYVPKLIFLIVIAAVIHLAIRLVRVFFRQIESGRLVFEKFPPEWADPTNKIVRVLLIAFGLVVAFPYLPASGSPAFAGISVFMGVLVSLSSSSALSNMIAGVVLTYTGAFKLGDRVKVGDAFGDIIETSLLATRVRTIKNEDITIPNSIALGSAVTNYSREARTLGLILHTSVTIGYDAPWRKIHELLIDAAVATPGILHEPKPFVWQTALNDFYVTYEINAYTARPNEMISIYAVLHSKIQDSFYAAGVEIMSPHYTSIRDGNTIAMPEAQRPAGYQPGAFRVAESTLESAVKPPRGRGV